MDVGRVCCKRAVNKDALVLAGKFKVFYIQTGKCLLNFIHQLMHFHIQ